MRHRAVLCVIAADSSVPNCFAPGASRLDNVLDVPRTDRRNRPVTVSDARTLSRATNR